MLTAVFARVGVVFIGGMVFGLGMTAKVVIGRRDGDATHAHSMHALHGIVRAINLSRCRCGACVCVLAHV